MVLGKCNVFHVWSKTCKVDIEMHPYWSAGDNSQKWRQSPYRKTASISIIQVMMKSLYILLLTNVSRSGDCLRIIWLQCLFFGGQSPNRGQSISLLFFGLSCAFYFKNAHLSTHFRVTGVDMTNFNPLHQRNLPLLFLSNFGNVHPCAHLIGIYYNPIKFNDVRRTQSTL